MANLTPVGVQAVVEGLSSFTSGMNQMQAGMQKTGEAAQQSAGPFSSLSASLSRAGSDFANLGQQLVTGAIVGGIGAVAAAFTGLIAASKVGLDSLMGWGEQLDRLGDQFGTTGQSASMWTVAMNRVGLSVEEGGAGLNFLTKNLDNVKAAQDTETTSTAKSADAIQGLNQRLADAETRWQRAQQTLAEAEKPTNAMRWAVDDAALAVTRLKGDLAAASVEVTKTKGTITPFQKALDTMGVSAFDGAGNIRSLDSIMPEIMDKFQKLPVGVNASALAMDLFGARGGTKFLDFLRQGRAGLGDAQRMAKAFGLEMSTEGVTAVEEYGFALNELNLGLTGIKNQIGLAVLPYARQFVEWAKGAVPIVVNLAKMLGEKLGVGLQFVQDAVKAFQGGGLGAGLTALFGVAGGDVGAFFDNLISAISNLANTISSVLVPAFNWVISNALPMMSAALGFVNENWDTFEGAIIAIGAVLGGAIVVGGIAAIAAAIASLVTPVGLIVAAAGLLGAAWSSNFLGMRDALTAFWTGTAQPALEQLGMWLQANLPAAIATLVSFWNGTLLPAFQATGAFIMGTVIPALSEAWTWLSTNIPAAVQSVSDFITGTLIPAFNNLAAFISSVLNAAIQANSTAWGAVGGVINQVATWINTYLMPAFTALGGFISAVFNMALTAMAGLLQNIVMPAFTALGGFIQSVFQPVLVAIGTALNSLALSLGLVGTQTTTVTNPALAALGTALSTVANIITNVLEVAVGTFVTGTLAGFQAGLTGIQNALTWVTQKLGEMTSSLNSVQLPDWLKPGSPTPFEIGLRGIADILQGKLSKAMEEFSALAPATFKAVAEAVSQIKDNLTLMADDTLVKFGEAMGSVGSAMVSNFAEADSAANRLADGMEDLRDSMSGISGSAQNIGYAFEGFNNAGNNIYNTLIPALQTLVDWLNNVAGAAAEAAANVGNVGGAAGGAGGPGFAAGVRNFVVPPGFPGDTYPLRVSTGERVTVIPRGQMAAGGQSTSVTVNFGDVAINNGMDLGELDMFIRQSVVNAIGA